MTRGGSDQHIRQWLFTPKLDFDDLEALNAWLLLRCDGLGSRAHPDQKDQTIDAVFARERAELRPLGHGFDGYVEKAVRVRSTCVKPTFPTECSKHGRPSLMPVAMPGTG